jgi:DNA-binding MarR family transcriptional regulator
MQSLSSTTKNGHSRSCAHLVLDSVPPVIWFIRHHMRAHRKGLSLPQFRALAAVDREPAVSLSALADHLGSSLPTASRIVAGLVKNGLLDRQGCSGDRRQCALGITPRGRSVLEAAWASTQFEMEKRLSHISAAQKSTLAAAMKILRGIFGSAGLPDSLALPVAAPPRTLVLPHHSSHRRPVPVVSGTKRR